MILIRISLVGQDTWFSPRRPGFKSRMRNGIKNKYNLLNIISEAMAQRQRVGFQTRRLGVRIPLASSDQL